MQPDPLVFLRGMRREVLRYVPSDFTGNLIMRRLGDALAHLAVRQREVPALLLGLRPQQLALLERTVAEFHRLGLPAPTTARDVMKAAVAEGLSSIAAISTYERLAAAQSACIAALAKHAGDSSEAHEVLSGIVPAMCALEQTVRDQVAAAVAAWVAAGESAPQPPDFALRPPTESQLTAYVRGRFPHYPDIAVSGVRRLRGVNQKEIHVLEVHGHPEWPTEVIMRRDRPFSTTKLSVAPEFHALQLLRSAGLPVPTPLLVEADTRVMETPFLFMERLPGSQWPVNASDPNARKFMLQLAKALAAFHRIDPRKLGRDPATFGMTPVARTLALVDRYYGMYVDDCIERSLTLESAYAWLRANVGFVDANIPLSLVHGDCDFRNILVDGDHISAILDWELLHVGDPAEDLGYCRFDVEQAMPWSEFMAEYQGHGGPAVSEERIRYFQVYGYAFRLTTAATAYSAYCTDVHRDFLFGSVGFLEYPQAMGILAKLLQQRQ